MMDELIQALNAPALGPVTWCELFGDAAGVLCVWLVARKHILNWPVGLLNNAAWFLSFWGSKLYGDATLQLVFAALGIYGWIAWAQKDAQRQERPIGRTTPQEWVALAAATAMGTTLVWALLSRKTDSPVPAWDASVVGLSLAATYLQARKLLESWWLWIAVDLLSIPLYVTRQLYPTAAVYALFLALCLVGLRAWTRALRGQEAAAPAVVAP